MERAGKAVVTIKEVAAETGLSLAAVSYALRNHPKIPAATRSLVHAAAGRLGYRPNPRIASLMAHIRRANARPLGERLAFVWVHTSRTASARNPFLRKVFLGARDRARQRGFGFEEFWTSDPGMSDRRLQQIMRARGIVGVVLSPVTTAEASITLDWDWEQFAVAVIGNVTWDPELHHASHHHYLGMRLALRELAKAGFRRPAALLDRETNERAKRAWSAAFVAHHPASEHTTKLLCMPEKERRGDVPAWLRQGRPDALIVSELAMMSRWGIQRFVRATKLPVFTLHWDGAAGAIGGIDQGYDEVAAAAVDLVATQLNSNETGVPSLPRIMLFPGRWVTTTRASAAASAST